MVAALAIVSLCAGVLAGARPASAHAELLESDPPAGARLAVAPARVTLRFSEAVTLVADSVRLIDATGTAVDGVAEATRSDGASTVTTTLPGLPDGGYVVAWRVVSADGHPLSGAFTFVVGSGEAPDPSVVEGAAGPGSSDAAATALKLLRAAGYLGLLLAVGLWAFVLFVDPRAESDRVLRGVMAGGGAMVAVTSLARIPAQAAYTGLGWRTVVDEDVGIAWVALAFIGVVLALAPLDWRRVLRTAQSVVLAAVTVGAGVAVAYGGHGAVGRASRVGLVATVVHVAAASVWVGGLAGLARRWTADRTDTRWAVASRYSTVATAAAAVVVASGVVQSVRQLDSLSEVTGTGFGKTLIVKVSLVAVLLAVAWISRSSVAARHERLGRNVVIELIVTALVLGTTGFLAAASPVEADDRTTAGSPGPSDTIPGVVRVVAEQGDRVTTVAVDPARVGANDVDISVFNRVEAGELPDEIAASIAPADGSVGAIDLPLETVGRSRVIATGVVFGFAGSWDVTVRARYGEFESVAFTAAVTIAP